MTAINLEWLEDFILAAEKKNFTTAANIKKVTQPTLTRRIKSLEEWLGKELFDPEAGRRALTPAGHAFLPFAQELVSKAKAARSQIRKL